MEDDRELIRAGYRYAIALCGESQDARDLVHEAWIRLQRRDPAHRSRPLFYTTVRNLYIDRYRRGRRFDVEPFEDGTAYSVSREASAECHVRHDELARHLERLRTDEREALYLNVVEGYTAEEIAQLTQRSRGTVLSLTHRARMKLRRALDQEHEPPIHGLTWALR